MSLKTVLAGILILAFAYQSHADGLPIKPGLWEFTTTTASSMGQPQSRTEQECIEKDKIDPKEIMQDMPDDCTLESKVTGNTLTYELTCNMHGMVMNGKGEMISNGDSMAGNVKFSGSMNGMMMEMSSESKGKRLKEC